ncbi:MAG: DUF6164 family protein [Enterobacterales bacterium]|nr:DUF6164 family protein [Enterobacterales bacterium]
MSKLLFKLNQVPDDEAADIRQLLTDNEFEFYETDSGRWGLGFAAVWLEQGQSFEQARALIDQYQQERSQKLRDNLQSEKEQGKQISKFEAFSQTPIRSSVLLIFAVLLAYFTVIPFFR